jgi:hypothetical protein
MGTTKNRMRLRKLWVGILVVSAWAGANNLYAQSKAIDVNKSSLKIRVFKTGAFSLFAHDHEIEAPIEEGRINERKIEEGKADSSAHASVQLRADSRKMRVLDPEVSTEKRSEIQHTMQGPTVLDVEKFPTISYDSTSVTSRGENHWEVRGDLTLHGKKETVTVEVSLQDGHYRGSASLKQSSFDISPISIAGGTVKVKDEVKIEFDIVAAK